ncbi:glycosyltransferase [Natronococcus sp. A-GB7]|uniref:glycosyltransferase n=1 Tax=Natronococcus sp. A-GB7 TaxID=3037649 RepID=UPI00241E2086|nr:glycosyltransferase [Natronococcus sp. A-GB7]MDG5821296.1 glycosyltransferase [Natronococcus sp. A-GB7]
MGSQVHVGIFLPRLGVGGIEQVAVNLSNKLLEYGYKVDIVLINKSGELLEDIKRGVNIVNLNVDSDYKIPIELREYLVSKEPDLLYSMLTPLNIIAIMTNILSVGDTKNVVSEHNMMKSKVTNYKTNACFQLSKILYPLADHIVTVSDGVSESVRNNTLARQESISKIYNPIDVDGIRRLSEERSGHPWIDNPSTRIIISGGRHETQKGFDTLIRSFSQTNLKKNKLLLFGEGPETDNLKKLVSELDVSDSVDFLGYVDNPYAYINESDVFVLSSRHEGFGIVLVEALACGCPIVSTNCESGPSEILADGKYGQLVPVDDEQKMAKAIEQVLKSPSKSDTLSKRASDFSVDNSANQYDKLFQRLLK